MSPQEFKAKYGHTLHTDPKTKQNYIKLPICSLNELAYMQESLLDGILLLTQLEKRHYKNEQMQSTVYWLCRLTLNSYAHDEINGLSEWLKNINTENSRQNP
ncbi:hypothetical protein [Seonamhaeicola sp.]|uniref:hypothetical protein n=1 Tax=Seonamhaeicola sp. TaxID=1912245 RepID=UPI00260D6081|nr:hypothetical protein [Seonamhaeicola sp.]